MKKVFGLFLSLLLFVTFSFAVIGCNKKEESAPEAPKVEAPAPAAEQSTAATTETKAATEEGAAATKEGAEKPATETK